MKQIRRGEKSKYISGIDEKATGRRTSVKSHPARIRSRKEPRQERSRQMVRDILQAAAETYADLGYARTTTNKVAERAGISVGSLYQYFPNKDSLLVHLQAEHHAEVHLIIRRALEHFTNPKVPIERSLRQMFEELIALHRSNPALSKALSASVRYQSPEIEVLHKRGEDSEMAKQVAALLAKRPDVRKGDLMAMATVLNQTTARLSKWLGHEAPADVDETTLLNETVLLLTRYLER